MTRAHAPHATRHLARLAGVDIHLLAPCPPRRPPPKPRARRSLPSPPAHTRHLTQPRLARPCAKHDRQPIAPPAPPAPCASPHQRPASPSPRRTPQHPTLIICFRRDFPGRLSASCWTLRSCALRYLLQPATGLHRSPGGPAHSIKHHLMRDERRMGHAGMAAREGERPTGPRARSTPPHTVLCTWRVLSWLSL